MKSTAVFLISVVLLFGCAAREDILILDENLGSVHQRIAMLERENAEMKKKMEALTKAEGEKAETLQSKTAQAQASIDRISEEVQSIRGKMEEAEFSSKPSEAQQREREARLATLEKGLREQQERTGRLENYLNLETRDSKTSEKPPVVSTGPEPPKSMSENEAYALGKQAFDRGEYEKARSMFSDLLKNHPASIHADNAQFWVGESYYREKWYEKAILEYQKVIEKYPTGNKVQSSLLKQGLAFQQIGDKANARLILKELVRKFPTSNESKIAQQKLKEMQ